MSVPETRHWVHMGCPFCGWSKAFSPESKPAAIRKACREIADHFVAHREAAAKLPEPETT